MCVCVYIYDRLAEMGVSARWIIAPVNCFGVPIHITSKHYVYYLPILWIYACNI